MTYEEFKEKVGSVILTDDGNCPVTPVVQMLQGKWKLQILYELCIKCPMRFGELKKMLKPITNTALTNALKELEADDLIQRIQYNEMPLRVEYSLTLKGQDLLPVFYAIMQWPLRGTTTRSGRGKKKNAGEISLTILAEVFSWYYPDSESITVYTQDRDSYDYQKSARERLNDVFASKTSIDVSYKSNDTLLCQMFRNGMLSLGQIDTLRCDERVVVYTRSRDDKSTALVAKRTDNQQFKALLQDMNVQIIF